MRNNIENKICTGGGGPWAVMSLIALILTILYVHKPPSLFSSQTNEFEMIITLGVRHNLTLRFDEPIMQNKLLMKHSNIPRKNYVQTLESLLGTIFIAR